MNKKIAILIPCFNEEATIRKVINDFQLSVPDALVYVFDNASTDNTANIAIDSGAIVCKEPKKGKGSVVKRMFADVDADIYVIVDGDDTYEASKCPILIQKLLEENLDLIVGVRKVDGSIDAYRWGHVFGNWMLTNSVSLIFGAGFTDMLSGYRVMSKRFVKSIPISSKGFEIETEMTVHALQVGVSFDEIETIYNARPVGSESKLNTFKDGFRILVMILILFKDGRPFQFFSLISLLFFIMSIIFAFPLFITYSETGFVPRLPTVILSTGLMVLAFMSLISGIILDSLARLKLETKRANYLTLTSPRAD
jgi:glycosyltransferase involved in cell wall biosynthesis